MKKKNILLGLILFFSFFVVLNTVSAEEQKVYWDVGEIDSKLNKTKDIPYFFSQNGYSLENLEYIVFNNVLESGKEIEDFDYTIDVSRDSDNSVILGVKQDTIYIQYSGILSFNSNSGYIFSGMNLIKSIDGFNNVDTSEVTNMAGLFSGMTQLASLDLSNFNTSKVTRMSNMFSGCSSLKSLDVSSFDTSKVSYVSNMFNGVNGISELDISNFDLSLLESNSCLNFIPDSDNLITIKTPKAVSNRCYLSLYGTYFDEKDKQQTNLNANQILTKSYTITYKGMTYYANNPPKKYIKHGSENYGELMYPKQEFVNRPAGTIFEGWYMEPEFITKVTADTAFENSDVDLYARFIEKTQLAVSFSQLINGYTPSSGSACSSLFVKAGGYCHSPYEDYVDQIEKIMHSDTLDESKDILLISAIESEYPIYAWIDGNILYFYTESEKIYLYKDSYSFSELRNIKELDLSKFDTSELGTMSGMFQNMSSLQKLDLSNIDTSNVYDMSYMFAGLRLKEIDVSNLDTSGVAYMSYMFYGMQNVEKLDLSNFDTSDVSKMDYMFYVCRSLKELNLSSFNTSNVTDLTRTFGELESLRYLDLSTFDLTKLKKINSYYVFQGTMLNKLIAPYAINDEVGITLDYYFVVNEGTARKNVIDSRIPSKAVLTAQSEIKYYHYNSLLTDAPKKYVSYEGTYGELYEPTAPDGFVFIGWYAEPGLVNRVTSTTVYDNITYTDSLYAKWDVAPSASLLNANTVSFKDNLSLNFLAEIDSAGLDGAYVKFKYNHYGEDMEVIVPVNVNDKNGNYYRFRCELTASEMMINVTAELYLKHSAEPVSTWTRSIRDYIISGLNNPSASDAEKALFRATLNYGGYTQKRFNYNGAPYAYEDYMDDVSNINILSGINFVRPEGFINGIKYVGSSVFFRNAPYVRYYFELENGTDINDYTFKIGDNIIVPTAKDNRYYIESTPSLAYELDKKQQVVVTKSDLNVIDIDYSIIKWAEIAVKNTNNEDESNMAKAMYGYYLAAKAFVDSNS